MCGLLGDVTFGLGQPDAAIQWRSLAERTLDRRRFGYHSLMFTTQKQSGLKLDLHMFSGGLAHIVVSNFSRGTVQGILPMDGDATQSLPLRWVHTQLQEYLPAFSYCVLYSRSHSPLHSQ